MSKLSIAIIIFLLYFFVIKYPDAKEGGRIFLKDIGVIESE